MLTTARLAYLPLLLPLLIGGCDQVQELVGSNAKESKPEVEAEAEAEEPASTKAKVAAAAPLAEPEEPTQAAEPTPAAAEPEPAAAEPEPAAAEPPAAPTEQPCIVGYWVATDYLAEINRAVRSDPTLKSLKYKSKSGTIGYIVEPPTDGTKGTIKADADDLTYKYGGKVQGVGVAFSFNLDGDITATYELAQPSRIIIDKPTENKMRGKARVKVKGFGSAKESKKVRHRFAGDYVYECSETDLKVFVNGRDGKPLKFARRE